MDNARLGRFLNGDANDEEFNECETLLEDVRTIVDENAVDKADPLIACLRGASAIPMDECDSSHQLVQRIEGVVAQQVISRDEIERLLDAPQQADELGRIGRYRVIEFMAAGGMGLVFKAEDSHLNRLVCIKIMHPALALKPDARLRFERESRAAAQLRSERIVTLLDIGVQRELPYIVMQLLDGESLRSKLLREEKLTAPLAVHYVMQIAEGLRHAHGMGILHRDIKPDNIWVTATGDIKLLDFGLARPFQETGNLTTTGGLIGTPQYMSPEQIQGHTLDARSDLFSLGVVLFEMLTGTLPFQKGNLFSTMIAITNDSISLPALEPGWQLMPDVETILQRLLKKNPTERIQSAQELLDQLGHLGSVPATTPPSTAPDKIQTQSSTSRGHAQRLRYVLTGVAGGLLAMLLLMMVMQTTDKGTLLVRSNDPQLEIRIAQEKVHVKDPLSGKSYEIRIGKTRLPSGVYQLEMDEATSGLTFSSNTIAIRRGETVLVEVQLQSKSQVAANDASNQVPEQEIVAPATVADELKSNLKNADPSIQLTAREDFARILARLPAQPVDMSRADRAGASGYAGSVNQAKLAGIDSWLVDTDTFVDRGVMVNGVMVNSDQTLLATRRDNIVQIWDKALKLKYTLRTAHPASYSVFDNRYPNLVAVSSYVGDEAHVDGFAYELTVWRLGADYAEIIYRLPCKGVRFAWDQGYRLFYEGREGLTVFRLDENRSYELHVPSGSLLENAISTNGRFLATHNGTNVDVWDLQRGEFAFTSLNNWRVLWNQQGDRAAFFASNRTAFEIWDLETRAIDDRVDLPNETGSRNQSGMQKIVIGVEPTFQRVAWLSPQGKLSIRNLRNNREHSQSLPNLGPSPIKNASLYWDGSSLIVDTEQASYKWTHDKSDVEGTFEERQPSELLKLTQQGPLEFTQVVGTSTPVLLWQVEAASNRNGSRPGDFFDRELYFDAFDMAENKLVHETPFSNVKLTFMNFNASSVTNGLVSSPYITLDGRYATASTNESNDDVLLYTLAGAEPPQKLELSRESLKWGGAATVWDKTSRFALFVPARFGRGSLPALQIYDTQAKGFVDQSKITLDPGKIIEVQRDQRGYVVVTRQTPPTADRSNVPGRTVPPKYSGELEVWHIDPSVPQLTKCEAATKLLAKIGTIDSLKATDKYVFVSILGSEENAARQTAVRKFYSIALDAEHGTHVGCVTVPDVDELTFSSTGEHVMREARDAEVARSNDLIWGSRSVLTTKGPSTVYHARWSDIAKDLGDLDAFEKPSPKDEDWLKLTEFKRVLSVGQVYGANGIQWHPIQETAAWVDGGYAHFFAPQQIGQKMPAWVGGQLMASDKGWGSVDHHEVRFFDASGQPIGKLMFDPYLVNKQPSRPRWRLADGSLAMQSSVDGLAISYQQGTRFYCESVQDFERARPDSKLPRTSVISQFELTK